LHGAAARGRLAPLHGADAPGRLVWAHCLPRSPSARDQGHPTVSKMRPVYFVGHPPGPYPVALPLPPPVILGKYFIFNDLAAEIYCKYLVLRYLEYKYLKTRYLCGLMRDARAGRDNAGLRSAHDSQLQVSGFEPNDTQMSFRRKTLITSWILRSGRRRGLTTG